jgi:RNA polymerase sigma-70 factor, ECF subfamily
MQIVAGANPSPLTMEVAAATSELEEIDRLVRVYRPRLLRFVVFSIGDQDLAESIVQDCFLKAYSTRATFRGECSVSTWLFRIANNLIRDHLRTKKFHFWRKARATSIDIGEIVSSLPCTEISPEAFFIQRERAVQVKKALDKLSPNQRRVFLLRFAEEMTPLEICEVTGMPLNTIKTHLHRGMAALRRHLGDLR